MPTDEELKQKASKIAGGKISFQIHFFVYLAVNAFFVLIWILTPDGAALRFPWFIFSMFGWGIGLVAHYLATYRGLGYQEKLALKEYQKLKNLENK